jgi:transcriptional regulator with XRE-family HTH domain
MLHPEKTEEEVKVAVSFLRALRGWTQSDLAEAAGISASSICRYESGETVPPLRTFQRIASAAGLPLHQVDSFLAFIRSAHGLLVDTQALQAGSIQEAAAGEIAEGIAGLLRLSLPAVLATLPGLAVGPWGRVAQPHADDRDQARGLWERLKRRPAGQRRAVVEEALEFRSWALCELCQRSPKIPPPRSPKNPPLLG